MPPEPVELHFKGEKCSWAIFQVSPSFKTVNGPQPNRKAPRRPQPSRMKVFRPPVAGKALESSETESAPHKANSPPRNHTESMGKAPGTWPAISAGERKMPEPMVDPMTTQA